MNKEPSEIAKLTERIAKDPKSKLFVPLAEEYKKAGDIEMSVHVLTEGLKNNPGYVTARSFLGKLLIEKGELAGAQKEFEEVVKAIPDNLMAQRKLADLYALQDRTADALSHYKIALSLNPKDPETAMLVAEAEAGREIKSHIHFPQPKTPIPEEQPNSPAHPEQPKSATAPAQPKPGPVLQKKPAKPEPAVEHEEAEEVLVVEPLDAPVLQEKPAAGEIAFFGEASSDQPASGQEPEAGEPSFSLENPFAVLPEPAEEPLQTADDPFGGEMPAFEADVPASREEQTEKQADDFTTDTLAELYIAQGFFEKAVDIYERMLIDKPTSQGLKDKLAKVRAMAAASPSEEAEPESDEPVSAEIIPEWPESEFPESSEAHAFDQQANKTGQPRLDDFELPATASPSFDEEPPVQPARHLPQPKQFDAGFEPREYIPPDATPRQSSPVAGPAPSFQTPKPAGRPADERTSPVSRKETVDRLENWLKNIIKEK